MHNAIAFFAFAKRRARKGQFNANSRSETSSTLSQIAKHSAIKNHTTAIQIQ